MSKTFQKEITFLSKQFVPAEDGNEGSWQEVSVKKTATFKELCQTDKSQHKLHFKLLALIEGTGSDTQKVNIDSDSLYDITVKSIDILLKTDENFSVQDKQEFLSDSLAILSFGLVMLTEKFIPFFSKFKMN